MAKSFWHHHPKMGFEKPRIFVYQMLLGTPSMAKQIIKHKHDINYQVDTPFIAKH